MEDKLASLQAALIHPHIRELPEASLLELERQRDKGRCRRRNELHLRRVCRLRRIMGDNLAFCWTSEIRAYTVE